MRGYVRFAVGAGLGAAALAAYLWFVGVGTVLDRLGAVTLSVAAVVAVLVVLEGAADGIGVWASVRPLGDGLTGPQGVQFALAGDFFDTLSPAGPVTSEPIMARFIGVTTDTTYSGALAVRSVAKYVKSGSQVLVSLALGAVLLLGGNSQRVVLLTLAGALGVILVVGVVLVVLRRQLSRGLVAVLAPVVARVSGLWRAEPLDRAAVEAAVARYRERIGLFRDRPDLLALIALGGLLEQVLTATALWVALSGAGAPVAWLPIVVVIPLPQAASVVPVPASLGAYDLLLAGALTLVTGAAAAAAAAAVLLLRTAAIPFALGAGGLCVAFLRGWRPV
ncbi:lysylphosphatidylglycerol synthase domain-containing protein [Haloglomus litoreum]|uniref:lysylphosphatidylglycerol synthase domain-containing protein n=1 Tax=Haloglomus litoreum TaxID=3034026 RepID=UPI0023E7A7E6|nr:lysylphosphatidylglycerol synthase domain-containing protein [Haloglomus sp. DT116]